MNTETERTIKKIPAGMKICLTMTTETFSLLRASTAQLEKLADGEEKKPFALALDELEKQLPHATFGYPS